VRELLKGQLQRHSIKREFMSAAAGQVRRYSVLANQHKYPQTAPTVNFHKRLLLEAIRTYLLADYRHTVTLQFMEQELRTRVFELGRCRSLIDHLTELYQKEAILHRQHNAE